MICCNPWVQREHDESFDHFTVYYFFCGGDVKYNQWNPVSLERKVEVFSTYKTFREKLLEIRIFALSHPSPRYHNLHFRLHLLLKFPPEKEEKKKMDTWRCFCCGVKTTSWWKSNEFRFLQPYSNSLVCVMREQRFILFHLFGTIAYLDSWYVFDGRVLVSGCWKADRPVSSCLQKGNIFLMPDWAQAFLPADV